MTREEAIKIIERVDICANAAETARDMAIAALKEPEVVRCKDCKWVYRDEYSYCYFCHERQVRSDHFCSYGERKDNGTV